jgi:hypothetical protein
LGFWWRLVVGLTSRILQGSTTMYATAPWLEALCAAPVLHDREAFCYSLTDLAAKPKDTPRFFKSHANFPDLPRGKNP